jgi:trk system potassium uptake protein TrkH
VHKSAIAYALGKLWQVLGLVLLVPLALGIYDHRQLPTGEIFDQPDVFGSLLAVILSVILGTLLVKVYQRGRELQGVKEGYAIVATGWVSMTFFSCLPLFFYLASQSGYSAAGLFHSFTDAYFEIMSGYTTF